MTIPWDAPAIATVFELGLKPKIKYTGQLRALVMLVLQEQDTNANGDGYVIQLDDGSQQWEGPQIADLGERVFDI